MCIAAVATLDHLDASETVVRQGCTHPEFVPGVEDNWRYVFTVGHQPPRRLPYDRTSGVVDQSRIVALSCRKAGKGRRKPSRARFDSAEDGRHLVERVHADQPCRGARETATLVGTQ